jgi:hypothetical protein
MFKAALGHVGVHVLSSLCGGGGVVFEDTFSGRDVDDIAFRSCSFCWRWVWWRAGVTHDWKELAAEDKWDKGIDRECGTYVFIEDLENALDS